MDAKSCFTPDDEERILRIRREIHEYPEICFDLPHTVAVVERELSDMGIACTEQYGPGSVAAVLNGKSSGRTIALRADMDALEIEEAADVPFQSKNPGKMHACGHDAHTAMLLGAAGILKRMEKDLPCRVKLLFQPSEEGAVSGAQCMCDHGVLEDVDLVAGLHVDVEHPTGQILISEGPQYAACHPYAIEFSGKSVHATLPHLGKDALAMAVKAYNDIYLMRGREIPPFTPIVLSLSSLHAGTAHNIIADHAVMQISFRFYDMQLHDRVDRRIHQICENAAAELDGSCSFSDRISCYPLINDPQAAGLFQKAAEKVVGKENIQKAEAKMSSEDFSQYLRHVPGVFARLGVRNEEKGCIAPAHNANFMIDEDALRYGTQVLVQFVLDQGQA